MYSEEQNELQRAEDKEVEEIRRNDAIYRRLAAEVVLSALRIVKHSSVRKEREEEVEFLRSFSVFHDVLDLDPEMVEEAVSRLPDHTF